MSKFVLPGSIEVSGTWIIAGVHSGSNEWDIKNLRYIKADFSGVEKGTTMIELLSSVYDNTTGCLIKGDFSD